MIKHPFRKLLMIAALCLTQICGCSCASEQSSSEEESESVQEPVSVYDMTIGQPSSTAAKIVLINNLSENISDFKRKTKEDSDFGEDLFAPNAKLWVDQSLLWHFEPFANSTNTSDNAESADSSVSDEASGQTQADRSASSDILQLKLEDGSFRTLNVFPYEDFDSSVLLKEEDGIAYLVYNSKKEGKEVSTLQDEKDILYPKQSEEESESEETEDEIPEIEFILTD